MLRESYSFVSATMLDSDEVWFGSEFIESEVKIGIELIWESDLKSEAWRGDHHPTATVYTWDKSKTVEDSAYVIGEWRKKTS